MRNPLKRFRHSYAELNKLITKGAGISLLLFVYIQNYTEEISMSNILALGGQRHPIICAFQALFLGRFRMRPVSQSFLAIARILGQASKS